jgi:hypothetical protein
MRVSWVDSGGESHQRHSKHWGSITEERMVSANSMFALSLDAEMNSC